MSKIIRIISIVIVVGLGILVWNGFYVLPEGYQVVKTQFGRPVGRPIVDAGLKFKLPWQDITFFDKKIQVWDGDPNQIPTRDKTYIFLDVTARWRIVDALKFMQAVGTMTRAQSVLDDIIDGTVRDMVNKNNLVEIIRSSDWSPDTVVNKDAAAEPVKVGRDRISAMVHQAASEITPQYGIELVDVMFKRVNYIEKVRLKVYERMISERKRIAAEKRSKGEGEKAEILGRVSHELKKILSTADRKSQEIRGRADAEAAGIYAAAYNRDPEFYDFMKSLEAYGKAVKGNTRLVISSDRGFYRYLRDYRPGKTPRP